MDRRGRLNLKSFLLRLLLAYVVLSVSWPFVRQAYNRNLGTFTAPLIRLVCFDRVTIKRIWLDNLLYFELDVVSQIDGTPHVITTGVDPLQYGFAHITFAALAFAIPGLLWRRRLWRWLLGAALLQAFFMLMIALNVLGGIAGRGYEYWSGDLITMLLPYRLYFEYRSFISILGQQFVPVLLWLILFRYSLWVRPRRARAGSKQ